MLASLFISPLSSGMLHSSVGCNLQIVRERGRPGGDAVLQHRSQMTTAMTFMTIQVVIMTPIVSDDNETDDTTIAAAAAAAD